MSEVTLNPPVTETRVVEVRPATVTLEMSLDQAARLKAVLGRVVGPDLNVIYEQLGGIELPTNYRAVRAWTSETSPAIAFVDNTPAPF